MAEPEAPHPAFAHEGAWTEEAYLALRVDGADPQARIELVDGSLLISPTTDDRRDRAVAAVRAALEAALPSGLTVEGPLALRLSPGRILVPDLVVTAQAGLPRPADDADDRDDADDGHSQDDPGDDDKDGPAAAAVRDSSVALLVVDVVGRGNGVADRWFKPQLYAGSRIPYALLLDHDAPFAVGNMLIGGRYHEYAAADAGDVLHLDEPFTLDLDLSALTAEPDEVRPAPADDPEPAPDPVAH